MTNITSNRGNHLWILDANSVMAKLKLRAHIWFMCFPQVSVPLQISTPVIFELVIYDFSNLQMLEAKPY